VAALSFLKPHPHPVPRRMDGAPAILQQGFRPFFQLAAVWAIASAGLWLAVLGGLVAIPSAFDPLAWHGHEAVYGFAVAAVAGFMLTAIPNWTGRLPFAGWPLAGLVALWLAGRAACLASAWLGAGTAMIVDLSFLVTFAAVVAREIVAGRNWRNLVMVVAIVVLAVGNAAAHAEVVFAWPLGGFGRRLGLAALLSLIALIGGRVVPSFTRNWLVKNDPARLPAPFGPLDRAVLLATVAALVTWAALPHSSSSGVLLLIAGGLNAVRLCRWRGTAAWKEPLLGVLHIGYAWLALGLLLLGARSLTAHPLLAGALHALSAGAIGTMVLAIMTRASLGHTGRTLTAGIGTVLVYLLVSLGAAARVAAPLIGAAEPVVYAVSGILWTGGFALFLILYGPMLWRSRP
jgi:uncharacterized protein involved in response to NO